MDERDALDPGSAWPDGYPTSLLVTFGLPDYYANVIATGRGARVLFRPSFHADVCIIASDQPSPYVAVATSQSNRGMWSSYERGDWEAGVPAPPRPERWFERADVPAQQWDVFWAELAATHPLTLTDESTPMFDGMGVNSEFREGSVWHSFYHNDSDYALHHQFVMAVYELAKRSVTDARSVNALSRLQSYLRINQTTPRIAPQARRRARPGLLPWAHRAFAHMAKFLRLGSVQSDSPLKLPDEADRAE